MTYITAPNATLEQEKALQPAFRDHLNQLADAPHYRIDAVVNFQQATVDGDLTVRYTNKTNQALPELVFRLLPNADTIYGGGSLTVDSVIRAGERLSFEVSQDGTVMYVPLGSALEVGDTVFLDIAFVAQVPTGSRQGYGIYNRAHNVLSLAGWYPMLAVYDDGWVTPGIPQVGDAMLAETSFYNVTLSVPAGFTVVSTGVVVERQERDDRVQWTMVSGPVREFAVAVSADFQRRQTEIDDVTVNYYTLPHTEPAVSPESALRIAGDAFRVYSERFGSYPFTEFDIVETAVSIGGYEFSGMVSVDYQLRVGGALSRFRYIVAHEVAHQWWYLLVGNNQIEVPWLDESFTTYSASIYLEDAVGQPAADEQVNYWKETYGLPDASALHVDSSALTFSNWTAYRSTVYIHGALFLDALRREIGDQTFFGLLQRYLEKYRYEWATTVDFLALAEEMAGRDLSPMFRQWFNVANATSLGPCGRGHVGKIGVSCVASDV